MFIFSPIPVPIPAAVAVALIAVALAVVPPRARDTDIASTERVLARGFMQRGMRHVPVTPHSR